MSTDYVTAGRFPLPVDRDAVSADWRERGYSCGLFTDPPGREWNGFTHATNEVVTVVDGELEVEVAGVTARLYPGDEVFIPAGAEHSVRNRASGTTRWLYGYD